MKPFHIFLQLETCFYTYIKYFYNYKPFLHVLKYFFKDKTSSQSYFFYVKMSAAVLVLYFSRCGSAFAPHCSSSDPVNPAAPPSTSPVPLVIGLVGGITLILFLLLLLLFWYRNSKSESCSCSFHFNQTYSKLLSRYSWRLKNKIM